METRGDDAFSVAINELTDAQDPDLNSTTANQGKKTLILAMVANVRQKSPSRCRPCQSWTKHGVYCTL